jgi:hypothetical protein
LHFILVGGGAVGPPPPRSTFQNSKAIQFRIISKKPGEFLDVKAFDQ